MERRLAAILVADVVGYTRLMGADTQFITHRLACHSFLARTHDRLAFELGTETLVSLRLRQKTPPSVKSALV